MLNLQAPDIEKLANIRDNINDEAPINPDAQPETAKHVCSCIRSAAKSAWPSKHILPKFLLQERAQGVEGSHQDWEKENVKVWVGAFS